MNKIMRHCFNPRLARGRLQFSDWPARLSIRIKRILNITFIQFPTSEFHNCFFCSFNNDFIFQNSFTF